MQVVSHDEEKNRILSLTYSNILGNLKGELLFEMHTCLGVVVGDVLLE